jgi:cysteinyl-tRNA synthetase
MFPHHENEIAQSECLHEGRALADHWLHNGMVQVGDQKWENLKAMPSRLNGIDSPVSIRT